MFAFGIVWVEDRSPLIIVVMYQALLTVHILMNLMIA